MKVLVSACLMGKNCKYSGGNNLDVKLVSLLKDHEVIIVCPELMGGLSTPRACAEIRGGRVINTLEEDVTQAYLKGAYKCVEVALREEVDLAVLQPRSPSCGCGKIYDGNFTGHLVDGEGVTAKALRNANIPVFCTDSYHKIEVFLHSNLKKQNL